MKGYVYRTSIKSKAYLKENIQIRKKLNNGEVLVKVYAASINPLDMNMAEMPIVNLFINDTVMGFDFAGIVDETESPDFKIGDKVYGTGMGALAEKIIAKDLEISLKPTTTTFIQAASLPVVSLTAYQALTQGEAKTGSRVLIVGASGGCGLIGIQMARYMVGPNGKVGGICGTHNLDFVRNMGVCDMVMDYKTPEVLIGNDSPLKTFGEFDLLYDTVSSPKPTDNLNGQSYDIALSKFFTPRTKTVAIHGVSARWLWMLLGWEARNFHLMICSTKRTGVQLQSIASMVDTGAVKPVIDSVYPFAPEGLESAYARLLSRRARGKVVIDIFRGQEV